MNVALKISRFKNRSSKLGITYKWLSASGILLWSLSKLRYISLKSLLIRHTHLCSFTAVWPPAPTTALKPVEKFACLVGSAKIHERVAHAHVSPAGHWHLQEVHSFANGTHVLQQPFLRILARDILDHKGGEICAGPRAHARSLRNIPNAVAISSYIRTKSRGCMRLA